MLNDLFANSQAKTYPWWIYHKIIVAYFAVGFKQFLNIFLFNSYTWVFYWKLYGYLFSNFFNLNLIRIVTLIFIFSNETYLINVNKFLEILLPFCEQFLFSIFLLCAIIDTNIYFNFDESLKSEFQCIPYQID